MSLDSIVCNYERAEITTAWVHDRQAGHHILIYCVVELCPFDQERSQELTSNGHPQLRVTVDEELTFYARRQFVSVTEAIAFFRNCNEGELPFTPPPRIVTMGVLTPFIPEEESILIPPNLFEKTGLGAVLPRRPTSLSVLSKFNNSAAFRQFCEQRKFSPRLTDVVSEVLSVDFARFPEHWGGVHLCFGNPIIRRIELSLGSGAHTVLVCCYERSGQSVLGCSIEFINEWPPFGQGYCVRQPLSSACCAIALPAEPHEFRMRLFDSQGRCLEKDSPGHFIRQNVASLSVLRHSQLTLSAPDGTVRRQQIETAQPCRTITTLATSPVQTSSLLEFMVQGTRQREISDLAEANIFRYFAGGEVSHRSAMEVVRQLMKKAQSKCTVVDPFLDSKDAERMATFIHHESCELKLLSSNDQLARRKPDEVTEEEYLAAKISELKKQLPFQIDARKMPGAGAHDRFLRVDNEVYMLGSSLNHFGARPTVLFKLQRPEEICNEIDRWWEDAEALNPTSSKRSLKELVLRLHGQMKTVVGTLAQIYDRLF